jgi:hypothetical protein
MRCAGHVASMEEMKNAYTVYVRIYNSVNKIGVTIAIAVAVFITVSENLMLLLIIVRGKVKRGGGRFLIT